MYGPGDQSGLKCNGAGCFIASLAVAKIDASLSWLFVKNYVARLLRVGYWSCCQEVCNGITVESWIG